ncbi:hypothetical protein [Streptomyces sp. NPDC050528]|uniref:hypothetical protein n=1 Tax=unclassified Streptomyces TaxID=2593676 RepID=UPI0037A924D4
MPDIFMLVVGVLAAVMAAVNAVQVLLGRQLIKPEASRRSAPRLRAESAAAAVALAGTSLTAFGSAGSVVLCVVGVPMAVGGYIALLSVRKRFG